MSNADEIKHEYAELLESLKTERDELRVKLHLASLEVQDEWAVVEKKWGHFKQRTHELEEATKETSQQLGDALTILGDELKEGYRRIKGAVAKH